MAGEAVSATSGNRGGGGRRGGRSKEGGGAAQNTANIRANFRSSMFRTKIHISGPLVFGEYFSDAC